MKNLFAILVLVLGYQTCASVVDPVPSAKKVCVFNASVFRPNSQRNWQIQNEDPAAYDLVDEAEDENPKTESVPIVATDVVAAPAYYLARIVNPREGGPPSSIVTTISTRAPPGLA